MAVGCLVSTSELNSVAMPVSQIYGKAKAAPVCCGLIYCSCHSNGTWLYNILYMQRNHFCAPDWRPHPSATRLLCISSIYLFSDKYLQREARFSVYHLMNINEQVGFQSPEPNQKSNWKNALGSWPMLNGFKKKKKIHVYQFWQQKIKKKNTLITLFNLFHHVYLPTIWTNFKIAPCNV